MAEDIVVPPLGESITEATIGKWMKEIGDAVEEDEPVVELETDKVAMEINAPAAGTIAEQSAKEGDTVEVGAVIGKIDTDGKADAASGTPDKPDEEKADKDDDKAASADKKEDGKEKTAASEKQEEQKEADTSTGKSKTVEKGDAKAGPGQPMSPAVRRLISDYNLDPQSIDGTGKDGRLTKGDVLKAIEEGSARTVETPGAAAGSGAAADQGLREERVPMTRLRKRIAERLKEAQNTAAMLTTYNDVDMSAVIEARKKYRDLFEKKHGIRLGFMSFFVKAACLALREVPSVNARIDGDEIVYQNFYDIGVAVSAPQGLVVPIVRDADKISFADTENTIADFGKRARDGKLKLDELQDGTFTISNGGIFGSLLSSPILNPPQSGILGMHRIEERPIVVNGEIVIRPMMYLALSYDHRIIDGREAVTFLVRMKEAIEDPSRLLLDL